MRRRVPRLPDAYQEVEYIESSGTQFVDSGYIITPNTEISADFQFANTTSQQMIFGIGQDNVTTSGINFNVYIGGTPLTRSAGLSDGTISGGTTWNNTSVSANTNRNKFVLNNGTFKIYDSSGTLLNTTNTLTTISRNATHSFGIFAWREMYYSAFRNFSSGKLYGLQVKEGGTLARDFVPCYRKSDDVIGLYDLVNDQFYTNAGSGTFTKGTDSSTLVYKEFQVWPDDQWQLRDETDMANSTTGSSGVIASTNGKFIRPSYSFGGGNGAYSKGTIDGYDVLVASSQHGNVHIGLSDANYTDLMSHKKVKIVWDYFNLGANQSNYTNGIWFGGNESLTDTSSSSTITVGSNWSGMSFSYNTGYSMEQIINTSDMSCTATITNLSNQAKSTFTYTKAFSRETNSTYIINGGGNRFIWMNDDYEGGPVRAGNIHVYYTD